MLLTVATEGLLLVQPPAVTCSSCRVHWLVAQALYGPPPPGVPYKGFGSK